MPADNADAALEQRQNDSEPGATQNVTNDFETESDERDGWSPAYIGNDIRVIMCIVPAEVVHMNTLPTIEVQDRRAVEDSPVRGRGVLRGYSSVRERERDIETTRHLHALWWDESARGQPMYQLPEYVPHIHVTQPPRLPIHGAGVPIVAGNFDRHRVAEYQYHHHHRPREHDEASVRLQHQQMRIQQQEQELELLRQQRLQRDAGMVNAMWTHETPGNAAGRDRFVRNDDYSGAYNTVLVHANPQVTSVPLAHSIHHAGVHQAVQPSFPNTGTRM